MTTTAHDTAGATRLLVVIADGVRPEVLAEEMDRGNLPAMARLRERGGMYEVSTSFPSVTGPAYAPFVMGRHPGHVGMPGLRWFDRSRSLKLSHGQSRSYSGVDIWHVDGDLDTDRPTLYDLVQPSLAGMMMIARGATEGRVGRGVLWSLRAAYAHFRGNMADWRHTEQAAVAEFMKRFERTAPRLSMLGLLSPDKLAHKFGAHSDIVRKSIRDVDDAIVRAQAIATRGGWIDSLRIWVTGDHGHAPVSQHDDMHGWLSSLGHRVLAHPKLGVRNADVALMVGGNAMAHVYLDPAERTRRWWPALAAKWQPVLDGLIQRASTGLVAVAEDQHTVRVHSAEHGSATVSRTRAGHDARWNYVATDGDPLQLGGTLRDLDAVAAWDASSASPYPDALVQLTSLMPSSRGGDIVVSAADGWDLRSRFEPTPHVSTHGGLLREQMMVPLILDAAPARAPQRTSDVVPSALELFGIDPAPYGFDGRSFL